LPAPGNGGKEITMSKHGTRKTGYRNSSRFFRERKQASQTFQGFPYLSTRIFPALYNINLYPRKLPELEVIALARQQVRANKLPACLALGWNCGLWFDGGGYEAWRNYIPNGGAILNGRLKALQTFPDDDKDLARRNRLLDELSSKSLSGGGYLVGNPENCVRNATPEDAGVGKLRGKIIPQSLAVCEQCGELEGECFYPESECHNGKIWKVTCRCENDNLCAACGGPLFHHKLDSCFYDGESGRILHVVGYCVLSHKCGVT
jgi:hypothetical protein